MSLSAHASSGFEATIPSTVLPVGTTKITLISFVYVPNTITNPGLDYRGLIQLAIASPPDATHDQLSLMIGGDDAPQINGRIANAGFVEQSSYYFYIGSNQNRWMVGVTVYDTTAAAADAFAITGRFAAGDPNAVAATATVIAGDIVPTTEALVKVWLLRDGRFVVNNVTTGDGPSDVEIAEAVIIKGAVTVAQVQTMLNAGTNPADFAGAIINWRLRNATDGLVDRISGVTLTPFGAGTPVATWNPSNNPTVADPSGGGAVPIAFTGTIPAINGTVGTPLSVDLTSYFSGNQTPFTYAMHAGTLPVGLSQSGGVISGTPSAAVTQAGQVLRGTDAASNTADSNSFSIVIAAAVVPIVFSGPIPTISAVVGTAGSIDLSGYYSGSQTPFTYALTGSLPTGFSRAGAVISWTTGAVAGDTSGLVLTGTDASANTAASNSFGIHVAASGSGTIIAPPLWENTNSTPVGPLTGMKVHVYNKDGTFLVTKTGIAVDSSGNYSFSDALIVPGTDYAWTPIYGAVAIADVRVGAEKGTAV